MSVIGYLRVCQQCALTMLVTADARHAKLCPDCAHEQLMAAIDDLDDHLPPAQVRG